MRRLGILLCLILVFFVACEPAVVSSGNNKATAIEEKQSTKEQIEALKPDDPRRQQVMALTWQIQYYREQIKTIEMAHMIQCYQSKEYRDALAKIEELNKQIRALLLL
jgi:hypothetical protein